ncbi:hypothetical protein DFQ45_10597 [Thiopseudomonas denitrificans]|uniref:Uncharacterized protein n=1 Tax=Thiopseudomonas denitrificans TaxID=1501432 RepID=A0A4R6TXY9_9GAMM|nr:hypothetical protein DFQ45_10597 [Thiopseudomonas denitrificans]
MIFSLLPAQHYNAWTVFFIAGACRNGLDEGKCASLLYSIRKYILIDPSGR